MLARSVLLSLALASLCGCSAGRADVGVDPDLDRGVVVLRFHSEGRNTFTVGEQTCEASKKHPCTIELPTADLRGGWNELRPEARRTVRDGLPQVRFFLGDEAFRRDCDVQRPGPRERRWVLDCRFDEGFHGELFGERFDGRVELTFEQVPVEAFADVDAGRAVAAIDLGLDVVNRAGGRWPRPIRAVAPVPRVDLRVEGAYDLWYEPELPLRVRVEPGAEVTVDGRPVPGASMPEGAEVVVPIEPGDNEIVLKASREGRKDTVTVLEVEGLAPATPLHLDTPRKRSFTTAEPVLRISGWTLPSAKLYLDSRRVPMPASGRFDFEVPLNEGLNEVQVMAVVDAGAGALARPPTVETLEIEHDPEAVTGVSEQVEVVRDTARAERAAAVLDAPLEHLGEGLELPLVVSAIDKYPAAGGCRVVLHGIACTDEVQRPANLAGRRVIGRACRGAERPVSVDIQECVDVAEGDRVRVRGVLEGVVAGRQGVYTVERPTLRADDVEAWPWVEGG